MSELGRMTAHYVAVLLRHAGLSSSIRDMHAEIEEAGNEDHQALEDRIAALEGRVDRLEQLSPEAR